MNEQEKLELERQRLELEKQKLEFEKAKFEHSKSSNTTDSNAASTIFNDVLKSNEKPNYVGIVFGILLFATSFMPWVSASGSVSILGQNYSQSYSANGFQTGHGYLISIFAFIGMFLSYSRSKYTFIPALFAILYGLSVVAGIGSYSASFSFGSSRAGFSFGAVAAIITGIGLAVSQLFFSSKSQTNATSDDKINIDFKSLLGKIIENKYLLLAISFIPVIALFSELAMFYGYSIGRMIFPWLFLIIIPAFILFKTKSRSIIYLYAISLGLILSYIIDIFFDIRLSLDIDSFFSSRYYTIDLIAQSISLILFLLLLSYSISLLLYIDAIFKDKAKSIKNLFFEKRKLVIVFNIVIGVVLFTAKFSYNLITTHEPTDEEKQQVIVHYEPLYNTKWVAVSDNITYPLEFSVPNIIKTESADGGKIYYEFSATFGGVKLNTREEVVVPSQISNLPNSFVLSRWGSYLTHRLISEKWSNDSIVGYVDELDGTRDMNIEKKISFVAYTKYFYEKKQQLISKELIANAAKNKSLLEGSYLNQTSNNGYQYTSFVEFKTNSNNLLEMLSGTADGDVSYDPTFNIMELKNLNDRIYALGKYEGMTEEDEMIEIGYFNYSTTANSIVFTYQNGIEYKKQNNNPN
jgi:hypothetical protein